MANIRENSASNPAGYSQFATTHWSIVLAAGHRSSPNSERALESLCQAYWYPLYAYVRRRVPDVHEAHDLTQAFFAELLEKNIVGPAVPERGRFRAYLLTCFKHFLSHQWEKAKAQKRGGDRPILSLDFDAGDSRLRIEPHTQLTADELYERQWVMALLERVMNGLREELAEAGKAEQFDRLKAFLVGDHERQTYAEVAEQLGISPAAAKMAASRLRRRYRKLLREEVAETVASEYEIDAEIRDLFATLGG